jgi:UDP-glucose 4-epimerase
MRDFINVKGIINAFALATDRLLVKQKSCCEYYNLSKYRSYSVYEIIDAVARITVLKISYEIAPRRYDVPDFLVGDSKLAKKKLSWVAKEFSINQIIRNS